MAKQVAGELYESITGQLFEIGRQLRQPNGYPFSSLKLKAHLQAAIEGRFNKASSESKTARTVLRFYGDAKVGPLTEQFVPSEFFKDSECFEFNDGGIQSIIDAVQKTVEPTETVTRFRLLKVTRYVNNHKIKAELSDDYKAEMWQIAKLIEEQKKGESGSLLTNGLVNIFYVADCTISVHWDHLCSSWFVYAYLSEEMTNESGSVVFSRN